MNHSPALGTESSSLHLAAASPRIAGTARAFLTPRRGAARAAPLSLPGARARLFSTGDGDIAALDAGNGPAALLVHGWEGQASDLGSLAHALVGAGLRTIVIDLPAHGASSGTWTSIPASARALLEVQRQIGALHAVVAHSVGAAVSVEALALGMAARRAVLIGAPARYVDYARAFAAQAGLDAAQTAQMLAELKRIGIDVASVEMPARAAQLRQPALFVHATDDRVVAIADAVASSSAWPGARLVRVDGLGHRRILDDAAVADTVTGFLAPHAVPGEHEPASAKARCAPADAAAQC